MIVDKLAMMTAQRDELRAELERAAKTFGALASSLKGHPVENPFLALACKGAEESARQTLAKTGGAWA